MSARIYYYSQLLKNKAFKSCKNIRLFSETEGPLLPGLTREQIQKISDTDKHLRNRHILIEANLDDNQRDAVRRRRMIYRAKQRGDRILNY